MKLAITINIVTWFALLAVLAWAIPARADTSVAIVSPTHATAAAMQGPTLIELAPTDREGCVAELRIQNRPVNGPDDNGFYSVDGWGLVVRVRFTWNAAGSNADLFEAEPPEGVYALPPVQQVRESGSAVIHLCTDLGVGF